MSSLVFKQSKNILEVELTTAKTIHQCDFCKASIDITPPKKIKGKKAEVNPAIQAKLEKPQDSGELGDFLFCDEMCLSNFLNKRNKK
jgi:hypothetical protein